MLPPRKVVAENHLRGAKTVDGRDAAFELELPFGPVDQSVAAALIGGTTKISTSM
jgi:hypothetical protein